MIVLYTFCLHFSTETAFDNSKPKWSKLGPKDEKKKVFRILINYFQYMLVGVTEKGIGTDDKGGESSSVNSLFINHYQHSFSIVFCNAIFAFTCPQTSLVSLSSVFGPWYFWNPVHCNGYAIQYRLLLLTSYTLKLCDFILQWHVCTVCNYGLVHHLFWRPMFPCGGFAFQGTSSQLSLIIRRIYCWFEIFSKLFIFRINFTDLFVDALCFIQNTDLDAD